MDFFDKLGDTIVSATREMSDKAKDVTDSTRMQYDIRKKKQDIDKIYRDLGKKYYEDNKDSDDESISAVRELLAEEKDLETQVANLKGGRRCPKCGAVVPMDSGYCNKCGSKLSESIFEEEDETGESEDKEEK